MQYSVTVKKIVRLDERRSHKLFKKNKSYKKLFMTSHDVLTQKAFAEPFSNFFAPKGHGTGPLGAWALPTDAVKKPLHVVKVQH